MSVVLKHLRKYRPDWEVDVVVGRGKESGLRGLCHAAYHDRSERPPRSDYKTVIALSWWENYNNYEDRPNSKITNCLREVFGIDWDESLGRYEVGWTEEDRQRAWQYLESIGCHALKPPRLNAVLVHYQGNTSPEKKNLEHRQSRTLCEYVLRAGRVPVILDWDRRCPFVDQKTVFNPGVGEGDLWGGFGSGDASTIAALISLAEAFVGIDSGPGKIASATQTPSLILWKDHLPIQFHDPAENTVHLIREDYARLPPCVGRQAIADYMLGHYQCRTYRGREHLLLAARDWLLWNLDCEITPMGFFGELRSSSYNRDYYLEHKEAGLDYLEYGDWQREYGRWLVGALGLKEKNGLDVGCACGAVLRGLGEAGAFVTGVDLCEPMIALGREKWPDMASLLNVCDACNLHHFADNSFDFLHCAQVAEHWKPALVPEILHELRRVTRPGGLFFCCLDTEELFTRQGRKVEHEDPTHVCVRPMAWWKERLGESGWDDATGEYDDRLRSPPDSFLKRYDWAWFVARKSEQ